MFSLPIAQREMLVQAKSPLLFRGRLFTSALLLVLATGFALVYRYAGVIAARQSVLSFSFMFMIFAVFAGASSTSDSVSREKRDGTLGFLFLSPLRPFQIALGKLIAGTISVFYALLAVLPLLSLAVIAGGVAWSEIVGFFAFTLNCLFASAAIGLYASTVSFERKKAQGRAVWIVIFFWWLLPAAAELALHFKAPLWVASAMRALAFSSAFGGPVARGVAGPHFGWINFACVHLLGWFFIGLAIFYLPRSWQEAAPKKRFSLRAWWKQVCYGKSDVRRRLRDQLLNRNPFLWLASRDRTRRWFTWLFTLVLTGIFLGIPMGLGWMQQAAFAVIAASVVLQFSWSGSAGLQLLAEQEQGTMEMILSTPLTPREIMRGQLLALLRQYSGVALLVLLLLWVVAAWAFTQNPFLGIALAIVSLLFVLNLYVLFLLGMWSAVTVKDPKAASGNAAALCLFLPAGLVALIMASLGLMNWLGAGFGFPGAPGVFLLWVLFQTGIDLFWIATVRRSFPVKMRVWAMRRYSQDAPRPRWWQRVVGRGRSSA